MIDYTAMTLDHLRMLVYSAIGNEVRESMETQAGDALAELVRRAEEAGTLRTERDRLARVLAVERGDESQAPEGWKLQHDLPENRAWWHPSSDSDAEAYRGRWRFSAGVGRLQGDFAFALEAMEAADKARGVPRE